jgi:general secretion pathway protein L
MLMEVAQWWAAQMRSLVPGASEANRQPDALLIVIDQLAAPGTAGTPIGTILLRQNGLETLIGPLAQQLPPGAAASHLPTGLVLPPGTVLQRNVVLPLAAAQTLQAVLGFEMDRLTPFAADEVYWGIAGLQPDHARGKLSLQLSVIPRAPVDSLCQALARIPLIPAFIEVPGGRIELAGARPQTSRFMQLGLSALCGILALACVAVPFIRQQIALDAAAQIIAANAPAAHTALALRQQLATAASGRAAIAQARRAGDALQVLATLTTALPDGTWLSDLALKSGDLTIDGQSTNAAQLIGLLSAVPGLRDPNFTAPVTRTADGKDDQFSLHAGVAE